MAHSFFAMLSRMKYINRWGLMRNARQENLSEHTLEVAYIAHALALMEGMEPAGAVFHALYHDCAEIITGDMPTPVKYYNEGMRTTYGRIEAAAQDRLLSTLPGELRAHYRAAFMETDEKTAKIVKAADKLSALMKCTEELRMGNRDFERAAQAQLDALHKMEMPAVERFLEEFMPAFSMTLDEMQETYNESGA